MTVISVNDVSLSFGARELFKNISFSLETNARLGIVGPNGCGKSTLLSLLLRENRHHQAQQHNRCKQSTDESFHDLCLPFQMRVFIHLVYFIFLHFRFRVNTKNR